MSEPRSTSQKRVIEDTAEYKYVDNIPALSDINTWYYPSHGNDNNGEDNAPEVPISLRGNWGRKATKGARWIRRGKMCPWGPDMEDWQAEERARKRLKTLLPSVRKSESPPALSHLRSPSPPTIAPYPPPSGEHLTWTSFVMDQSVTRSFRSGLVDELEQATNNLIEGEADMRRALGRLWQIMSVDPESCQASIAKQEEDSNQLDDRERRLARAPDLTPATHKLFLLSHGSFNGPTEQSHFSSPETQMDSLEKSLATLRELQDDGREYVERLEEIREGLGEARTQRDSVWHTVRERAIEELKEVAFEL